MVSRRKRILSYESYICGQCREHSYSEITGDPTQYVPQHTLLENLPDSWQCPVCNANKNKLLPILAIG